MRASAAAADNRPGSDAGTAPRLWQRRAEHIGAASMAMAAGIRRFLHFLGCAGVRAAGLTWLQRPAVKHVLIRQMYFTGVQGLPWVVVLALGAGVLAVYTIVRFAKGVGEPALIGDLVNGLLLQELAPLTVALLLLARSGVAVVTEIAHMHIRGERLLLASLGIDTVDYLHLPRLAAFALCGPILTAVFAAVAIWIGGLVVAYGTGTPFTGFLAAIRAGASLVGVVLMVTKAALYPLLSCSMLLFHGSQVGGNPNRMPVCATNGVLAALMIIILADVAIGAGLGLW